MSILLIKPSQKNELVRLWIRLWISPTQGKIYTSNQIQQKIVTLRTVKDVKKHVRKFDPTNRFNIQNSVTNYLNNCIHNNNPFTHIEKKLLRRSKMVSAFLQKKSWHHFHSPIKAILLLPFSKQDYLNKINNMLRNTNTYSLVNKDPTWGSERDLHDLLNRWVLKDFINNNIEHSLMPSNFLFSTAYRVCQNSQNRSFLSNNNLHYK